MKSCPHCKSTFPTHFTVCPQDASHLEDIRELAPGTVLRGKYKILTKLGEGGMGAVYKAQHIRFDEICALKVVLAAHLEDSTFLQRFHAEAMLMRRLDHPHAVRVQDVDETEDGRPFFVMEYIEGETLERVLERGPIPADRAIRIALQACDALGAAHRLGVIHRDIKPGNLLLARNADGSDNVKVMDFGIAKVMAGSPLREGASITQTGAFVGTPAYMSPEQCQGARGELLTGASDLYSLGVVLYHMLTGTVPFKADTAVGMLMAHLQQAPPDPRDLQAQLPPLLVAVVLRAMEKDVASRYTTAEEMRAALEEAELTLNKTTVGRRPLTLEDSATRAVRFQAAGTPATPAKPGAPVPRFPAEPPGAAARTPPPEPQAVLPADPSAAPPPPIEPVAPSAPVAPAAAPPAPREPAPPLPIARGRSGGHGALLGASTAVAVVLLVALGIWIGRRPAGHGTNPAGEQNAGASDAGGARPNEPDKSRPESGKPPSAQPEPERSGGTTVVSAIAPQFTLLHTLAGHKNSVLSVAFTPGGRILASGSLDGEIGLWDSLAGKSLGKLSGHTGPVYAVAFGPGGKLLASGSGDGTARIWEISTARVLHTLTGHAGKIYALAFSPDGQMIATGSNDRTVKSWDVASGREVRTLSAHTAAVAAVAFSPDGQRLASGGEDGTVVLWDAKSGNRIETMLGHTNYVHSVAFSPDGKMLASASRDETIRLWEVATGGALRTLHGHRGYVEAVTFSPDGRVVVSGGEDGALRFWDAATGKDLGALTDSSAMVISLAYGENGALLAVGGADKTIRLWQRTPER